MREICQSDLPDYLQGFYNSVQKHASTSQSTHTDRILVRTISEIRSLHSVKERVFGLLLRRHCLTEELAKFSKCYPPVILQRAQVYELLEYDDLAVFDAYVVYTLCQKEVSDEFVTDLEAHSPDGECWNESPNDVKILMAQSLALLVRCLTRLRSTEDARVMLEELQELKLSSPDGLNQDSSTDLSTSLRWNSALRGSNHDPDLVMKKLKVSPSSRFGASRREIYPWSTFEPARNTHESVIELNEYLAKIAPGLEAKVTSLPAFDELGHATGEVSLQLGLFARTDLQAGQEVLSEKSILTAIRPLEDALCDACGQDLEGISFDDVRQCDGDDCDVTFCSQDCKDRAVRGYHHPLLEDEENEQSSDIDEETGIGIESTDLQESSQSEVSNENAHVSEAPFCSNQDLSLIGRPTTTTTAEWDLYFLLLTRTIAMSTTQKIHPLSLPETKYLWADFTPCPFTTLLVSSSNDLATPQYTLPFSLQHNVILPLDYFTSLSLTHSPSTPYSCLWLSTFDPWILQTLYAKFRGVANATQSTFDGQPEIAAVHAGWCLANHSCAPNVRWDPTGVRKFWVRNTEEMVKVGDGGATEWKGIKEGEEIFSHYTDVRLGVEERRDRLREVLGGNCRCERCLVEAGEE